MLTPYLHFNGNCNEAIALYETAFDTKVTYCEYRDDGKIAHADMFIHDQRVCLNDASAYLADTFGIDCTMHLMLTFNTQEELLACYSKLKEGSRPATPFTQTPYSELVGNFVDRFGVLWGFMVESN